MRRLVAVAAVAAVAALAACGGSSPKSSQVVAKVNDAEVSVHQLNFVLQRTPGIVPERAAEARKELLERLVDQELAVQKAKETRLDRDPDVVQRIEAARREVLARAYLERAAGQVPKPTGAEIEAFYRENPLLFAERRVWRLDEIVLPVPPNWPELSKELVQARTVAEAATVLKARGIDAAINPGVSRASEGVPLDVLPRLAKLKEGDVAIYAVSGQVAIAQIRAIQPAPVDAKQAGAAIEQFLLNRRRAEAVQGESKRLRDVAKIEYRGEFATGGAPAPAPAAGPAPERPAATGLEKGISGLK